MHLWHLGKHIKHLAMQLQHWQLIIANASLVDGVRVLFLHFKYVPWTSHMQGVDRAAASCDNLRRRALRLPRGKTVGTKHEKHSIKIPQTWHRIYSTIQPTNMKQAGLTVKRAHPQTHIMTLLDIFSTLTVLSCSFESGLFISLFVVAVRAGLYC